MPPAVAAAAPGWGCPRRAPGPAPGALARRLLRRPPRSSSVVVVARSSSRWSSSSCSVSWIFASPVAPVSLLALVGVVDELAEVLGPSLSSSLVSAPVSVGQVVHLVGDLLAASLRRCSRRASDVRSIAVEPAEHRARRRRPGSCRPRRPSRRRRADERRRRGPAPGHVSPDARHGGESSQSTRSRTVIGQRRDAGEVLGRLGGSSIASAARSMSYSTRW